MHFQQKATCKLSLAYNNGIFLHVILARIIVLWFDEGLKEVIRGAPLDISNIFGRVWHDSPFFKLKQYGVTGKILNESLRIALINVVKILMMSGKMATPGLLKKNDVSKKVRRHNFCPWRHQKNLSRDSNYTKNVVIWPKFGNSSISVRGVIIASIL